MPDPDPDAPPGVTPLDLELASGRIHAEDRGPTGETLVIAVPGLSANLRGFDFLAERLASRCRIVALDLRGRGHSDMTPPGTYGWANHARDVIGVADALGVDDFVILGQSMGAFVAMEIARQARGRLRAAVLLDACGLPDPETIAPIRAAVERLGAVYPSFAGYLALVQQLGTVRPWSPYWERYFRYELADVPGGVQARSDRAAVLEDAGYGESHSPRDLWPNLKMPVLLARATEPLVGASGFIVPEAERDAFLSTVRSASLVEINANHYGINTHPATATAIEAFLATL
jgi:pimeloyl-ACP methyl ester carboxylesterase